MHLLLLRFSSLGDIVLQTSFISWLKYVNPKIRVSFITSAGFESLIENHKDVDQVYGYEKSKGLKDILNLRKFVKKIDNESKIDFIIDLHGTTRASYLKLMTPSIPSISIDKRKVERHFLVHCGFKLMNQTKSIHSRNIHDLIGLFPFETNLDKFITRNQEHFNNPMIKFSTPLNSLEIKKTKTIIIAPVASFKNKRWNILKFKELILKLLSNKDFIDFNIVNLAGPNDDFCRELDNISNKRFTNLQGKTSLSETINYIKDSSFLIGNDSGLGHIAESFGVGVLAIFGPTHETLGFKPHLDHSLTVSKKLWCRPCTPTGKGHCFRRKVHCTDKISVEEVYSDFIKAFKNAI